MVKILINQSLKLANPNIVLGVIQASITVEKYNAALWLEIEKITAEVSRHYVLESLSDVPEIKAVRNTYKALGKEPSRYRGSAEALLRRIVQGKGMYKVNNIVDINNLVSVKTVHPVGSYDLGKLSGQIFFRVGTAGEAYKGIGKEMINVAELPVFADQEGVYGSPTSDSERAMITESTKEILLVIISFSGDNNLQHNLTEAVGFLEKFAGAINVQQMIVA